MGNIIELDQVVRPLKTRILVFCLKTSFFALLGVLGAHFISKAYTIGKQKAEDLYAEVMSRVTKTEYVKVFVQPAKEPVHRVVERVSREYGLPPLLINALHIQESGRGLRPDRMRFEPKLQSRFKREPWMTDIEHQALATSWGLGQIIYGIWRKTCELESYADLLDPEINVTCSAKILRGCLDRRAKVQPKSERFRQCLSEYNGDQSGGYAASVLNHLTDLIIEQQTL